MPVVLHHANASHREFVRELSGRVFSRFGRYDVTLPPLVGLPWTHTIVAVADEVPVGFAICGLEDRVGAVAELIAIAVEPGWHGRGVGRLLLEGAETVAVEASYGPGAPVLRLSVAEDNAPARRLFDRAGYRRVEGEEGTYPAGQRSIGMAKVLVRGESTDSR
jgi:ribosomal protein S18 acetylase RimI-like enzyme